MSEYWPYLLAATASLVVAINWAAWRMWPIWRGRAPASLPLEARVERWNRHMVPFLRRVMKDRALVANVDIWHTPTNGAPPRTGTVAVWCLTRTVIPDVDWLALARPVAGPGGARIACGEVLGVIPAATLREVLVLDAPRQDLFGHVAYVYVWPGDAHLEALVAHLMPIDAFEAQYHWTPPAPEPKADPTPDPPSTTPRGNQ